jgi:adenylate cyclase
VPKAAWLRVLALWRRFTNIGIDANVPAADVKHIRLCNIGNGFIMLFFFGGTLLAAKYGAANLAVPYGVLVLLYGVTLLLNHLRRYLAARIYYAVLGSSVIASAAYTQPSMHMEFTFATAILAHFFIYPPRQRKLMYVHAAVLASLSVFFSLFNAGRRDLDPLSPEAAAAFAFYNAVSFAMNVAVPCFFIYVTFWRAEEELAQARAKSEALLLNVLPESIALRLKDKPESLADQFDEATVLFADIVNFTKMSLRVSPVRLVALLDQIFAEFDRITERLGLEKIKTIGDAYMVAGGIPEPRVDHAEAIARMALEMLHVVQTDARFRDLNLRVGIHTGPIVAGVIGRKKFIYDLWGDSVNTASRMESHGVEGRIQVTEETYERLRHAFTFEERGIVEVKGKGPLKTYFLTGTG